MRSGGGVDPGLLDLVAHGEQHVALDVVVQPGKEALLFLAEVRLGVLVKAMSARVCGGLVAHLREEAHTSMMKCILSSK